MPNYNHYTPQSDGSYRRSTVSEPNRRNTARPPYPAQPPKPVPPPPPPPAPVSCDPEPECATTCHPPEHQSPCSSTNEGILSFLRGLLPREIDAADLLVISLLLLMNREEGEGGLSPLLTIALYFLL